MVSISDPLRGAWAEVSGEITIRNAAVHEIPAIFSLMFEHGPNEWNYLPEDEIREHLEGMRTGETFVLVACDGNQIIGMASYNIGNFYPQYEKAESRSLPRGYIAEVVVHQGYSGKGLGSRLLEASKSALRDRGIKTIYIKRHEENLASAGMMRKAGFQIVDTFPDSIRTTGSGRTTVEKFIC